MAENKCIMYGRQEWQAVFGCICQRHFFVVIKQNSVCLRLSPSFSSFWPGHVMLGLVVCQCCPRVDQAIYCFVWLSLPVSLPRVETQKTRAWKRELSQPLITPCYSPGLSIHCSLSKISLRVITRVTECTDSSPSNRKPDARKSKQIKVERKTRQQKFYNMEEYGCAGVMYI